MKIRSPGHIATAFILGLLAILVLTVTAPDIGVTWDEPVYIEASESYMSWLAELTTQPTSALGEKDVDEYWALNHEHPPFDKATKRVTGRLISSNGNSPRSSWQRFGDKAGNAI